MHVLMKGSATVGGSVTTVKFTIEYSWQSMQQASVIVGHLNAN